VREAPLLWPHQGRLCCAALDAALCVKSSRFMAPQEMRELLYLVLLDGESGEPLHYLAGGDAAPLEAAGDRLLFAAQWHPIVGLISSPVVGG